MERRLVYCLLVTIAIGTTVFAKDKSREWQDGRLLDTEKTRFYVGTSGMSKTTGTVDVGDSGYGRIDTDTRSEHSDQYKVYQKYAIETSDRVYLIEERIRWVWSKAANLEVNGQVRFAVEGDTVYLLDQQGKEHKTRIVKTVLKSSVPSSAPPNATPSPENEPSTMARQPNLGTVVFKSTPDAAEVTVDGKFVGTTPSTLRLAPGDHSVLLQKKGFKEWSRTLAVGEGANLNIDAELDRIQ